MGNPYKNMNRPCCRGNVLYHSILLPLLALIFTLIIILTATGARTLFSILSSSSPHQLYRNPPVLDPLTSLTVGNSMALLFGALVMPVIAAITLLVYFSAICTNICCVPYSASGFLSCCSKVAYHVTWSIITGILLLILVICFGVYGGDQGMIHIIHFQPN